MKKKAQQVLLLLIITIHLNAQMMGKHTIYFESGKFTFSKEQNLKLDSFIRTLTNIPEAYEVYVSGHTDNKGSLELNNQLSKNRSLTVLNNLKKRGFKSTDSSLRYFAFNNPVVENTELGLWQNRRVTILVYKRSIHMTKVMGITDFIPKKYTINEDSGGILKYDSTILTIAPNSFVNTNGSEVVGNITIDYIEYRSPADFLLGGIPMSIEYEGNIQHFESAGMFNINASQNNKNLVLKQDKAKNIIIDIPLKPTPDQQLYKFDTVNHQWINLQPSLTAFIALSRIPTIFDPKIKTYSYPNCITGDTCQYFDRMFTKMKYYLNHTEPLVFNTPYKAVKNNVVDYKSSYYKRVNDTLNGSFHFISLNAYNKLGRFSSYEWKTDGPLPDEFCSFIKIIYLGEDKFQIKTNSGSQSKIYNVTGRPTSFKVTSKLSKINSKNNNKYIKELHGFDKKEEANDAALKTKLGITAIDEFLYDDSLKCFADFYIHFLADSSEFANPTDKNFFPYFNQNKEKILSEFDRKKTRFDCGKFKNDVSKFTELEKLKISTMAKLGISSLGIFNADAVKRISNPQTIAAKYILKKNNKEVKIIKIFLVLSSLNGLIQYDGFMGYSPYRFVYGTTDLCHLTAVDENLNYYFVSDENFKAAVHRKTNDEVIFILTPTKELKSKENLENLFSFQ